MRMVLATEAEFDAAHHLPGHKGKCAQPHGHRWKVRIEVITENTPPALLKYLSTHQGMLADFGDIREAILRYDHSDLNDILKTPTAELLAMRIGAEVRSYFNFVIPGVIIVTVWENPESSVTVREDLR